MRTKLLLAAHALSGLVATLLGPLVAYAAWANIVFVALAASQLYLLGMWAGFSRSRWALRLTEAVGGTVAIWAVIAFASRSNWRGAPHNFKVYVIWPGIMATLVVLTIAVICLALRRWWVHLGQMGRDLSEDYHEGLKFSLGQLLGLICFYAVVLATGRAVASAGIDKTVWTWTAASLFVALSIAFVPVAASWSALGRERLLLRMGLALVFVGVNGLLPPTVIGLLWWQAINWMLIYLATCILIVLNLLVVRSNGYRVTYSAVRHH